MRPGAYATALHPSSQLAPSSPQQRRARVLTLCFCPCAARRRIGTEHEKLGYNLADTRRLTYDQIAELLRRIGTRFNWDPIMEGEHIIGLRQAGQSVTLEPGGQFELSGATVETLHETCAEVNSHLYQVRSVCEELGIAFLGAGFDPKWRLDEIPRMPKER
jgi:glutamate--cysteine ligase